jgi:hypothetical protein
MKSFLVDQTQDSNDMLEIIIRGSLCEDTHGKNCPIGKLNLKSVLLLSFACSRSVGGMYGTGTGGRFPKCPFSHLESFNPSGVLEDVLILEER